MKSGFVAAIASANDFNGIKPRKAWMRRTTFILPSGCPEGHTASTQHPAPAKAMASRAVGNQREVVAIRTVGFTA